MIIKKFRLFENIRQAKSILSSKEISEDDKDYKTILKWCNGKDGYVGWFTKMRYEKGISIDSLKEIIDLIINDPFLIKSLPKNLVLYDEFESLQDDIEISKSNISIRKCYNEFPSLQRKLLDRLILIKKETINQLLLSLWKLKNVKDYFKKVSRYKGEQILIDSIKSFIEGNSEQQSFESIIRSTSIYSSGELTKIVSDKNNEIIIIRAISSSVVTSLGRGTSWCIRDSGTFMGYVPDKNTCQYIIWLTDISTWSNYSIIGLTIGPNGYRTSHLKDDSYIGINELLQLLSERKVDIKKLYPNIGSNYNMSVLELKSVFGISEDEIFKNKKNLSIHDISSLSKDKLGKYGITIQFSLGIQNLLEMGYTKEEIFKNKKSYSSTDCSSLTKDEIRKIGFDKFNIKDLYESIGVKEVLNGRTQVLNDNEFDIIGPDNILLYNLGLNNVGISAMISDWRKKTFGIPIDYILSHKSEWNAYDINYLDSKSATYVVLNHELNGVLDSNRISDKEFLPKSLILDKKIYKRVKMSAPFLAVRNINIDEVISNKMDIEWGNYVKEKPNFKKSEWRACREFLSKVLGKLSQGERSHDSEKILSILKFYNMDLENSIQMCDEFELSSYRDSLIIEIFDLLISKGFKIKEISSKDLLEFINNMTRTRDCGKELFIKVVIHYELSDMYNDIISIVDNHSIVYDSIKGLEGKGVDSKLRSLKNNKLIDSINNDPIFRKLFSTMGSSHDIGQKDIDSVYSIFKEEISKTNWKKRGDKWVADRTLVVTFFILSKMDKLDEFDPDKYEFDLKTLTTIFRILCGTASANNRKYLNINLSESQQKDVYNWLKKNYFPPAGIWENPKLIPDIIPITYAFDKKYFEYLFNTSMGNPIYKANYSDSYPEKEKKISEFFNFKQFIEYLLSSTNLDNEEAISELKSFVDKVLSLVKNKTKKNAFLRYCNEFRGFYRIENRYSIFKSYANDRYLEIFGKEIKR